MPVGYPWFVLFIFFRFATTLSGLLHVFSVIIKTGCRQMSEPGELRYSPFPPAPEKKTRKKQTKIRG
jgi:hypothetical protein